jgi:hypothetical protein
MIDAMLRAASPVPASRSRSECLEFSSAMSAFRIGEFVHVRREWVVAGPSANGEGPAFRSQFRLFGEGERIFYVDAKVADSTFQLCMPEQELHCS